MSTHEYVTHVITRTMQLCAVAGLLLLALHHGEVEQGVQQGVQAVLGTDQVGVQEPAPITVTDLGDEQWWTTTDCPIGVEVPCLDPTVDPALVPADVAAQLHALAEAQWSCFAAMGYDTSGDVVYPSEQHIAQCRSVAYLATAYDGSGCWVEGAVDVPGKGSADLGELICGDLDLMPAGSDRI